MVSNSRLSSRAPQITQDIDADFATFDALERPLKKMLWEFIGPFSATDTRRYTMMYGMQNTIKALGVEESNEIVRFACQYEKQTGSPYPFVAAQVTIQRYGFGLYRKPVVDTSMKVPDVKRRRVWHRLHRKNH